MIKKIKPKVFTQGLDIPVKKRWKNVVCDTSLV